MQDILISRVTDPALIGLPPDWPDMVSLALRREAGHVRLIAVHLEEDNADLQARLARFERCEAQRYLIREADEADIEAIILLALAETDLAEFGEEFIVNYEFLSNNRIDFSRPARPAPLPDPSSPEEPSRNDAGHMWDYVALNNVVPARPIIGPRLELAPDGAATLETEDGLGDFEADAEMLSQSPDGHITRLSVASLADRAFFPGTIRFPAGSFLYPDREYELTGRGDMIYFRACPVQRPEPAPMGRPADIPVPISGRTRIAIAGIAALAVSICFAIWTWGPTGGPAASPRAEDQLQERLFGS